MALGRRSVWQMLTQVVEWESKHKALQATLAVSSVRIEELERERRKNAADIASAHRACLRLGTRLGKRSHRLDVCWQARKRGTLKLGLWMRSLDSVS